MSNNWTGQQDSGFSLGGVQLHGGGGEAELAALIAKQRIAGQQQWGQAIGQVGKAVSGIMAQQRQNAIADVLLKRDASKNELDFYSKLPGSPADKYKLFLADKERQQKDESQGLAQDYKISMIQKALGGTAGSTPTVDPNTGLVWNGRQWTHPVKASQTSSPWGNTVPVARGKLDEQGQFTNQYTGAEQGDQIKLMTPGGKAVVMPYAAYQAKTGQSDGVAPPGASGGPPTMSSQDQQALEWAKSNPDDPRAAAILQKLGLTTPEG